MPAKRTQRKLRNRRRKVGRKSRRVKQKRVVGGGELVPVFNLDGRPIKYSDMYETDYNTNDTQKNKELYIDESSFKKVKDNLNNLGIIKSNIFNLTYLTEIDFYTKKPYGPGFIRTEKDIREKDDITFKNNGLNGAFNSGIGLYKEIDELNQNNVLNDNQYYLITKPGISGFRSYKEVWQDPKQHQ